MFGALKHGFRSLSTRECCRRTLNREQLRHRAVSLRKHGFLGFKAVIVNCKTTRPNRWNPCNNTAVAALRRLKAIHCGPTCAVHWFHVRTCSNVFSIPSRPSPFVCCVLSQSVCFYGLAPELNDWLTDSVQITMANSDFRLWRARYNCRQRRRTTENGKIAAQMVILPFRL